MPREYDFVDNLGHIQEFGILDLDEYREVINGENTYNTTAKLLMKNKSHMFGWTDGLGTHYDILLTLRAGFNGNLQQGMRWCDFYVSIIGKSCFGFLLDHNNISNEEYIAGKLGLNLRNETDIKLSQLVLGIKNAVIKEKQTNGGSY